MLQSGAVWWRGDLLQRRRSTPSSAYPVYRVERQDQQPHGTLGAGRGEQWVEVELSWAWACAAKIVVVEGFIIRDPSSFSTACLDLPFRAREATGHKAGMRWAFAVEAGPITGPAPANGGCSAQTKPQAPSQGVTSGRRVRPAVSPVISAVSLLWNQPLHCHSAHAAHAAHASHTALHSSWREPHEPLEPLTRPAACCIAAVVLGWR